MLEKIKEFQVVVSCLIIGAIILISSLVFASKIQKNESVTVTGSASKVVKSDSGSLQFSVQSRAINQKEAFNGIKRQTPEIIAYLTSKGIKKEDIDFRAMSGYNIYKSTDRGVDSSIVVGYSANQNITVKSTDVEKIKEISTDIQSLVDKGISLDIYSPEYYYSDLASIKIDLLKEAALDAKQRAKSMLSATGSRVGKIQQMKMGVFQITEPNSTSVSDMGINDTLTIDKKVTAVTNIVFKVR